jgi:hypothetical protein
MTRHDALTPHDTTPELALDAIRMHSGPILLDLDETLYLRNSTEDFIDTARPRLLGLLLMRALDVARPWRWTGGEPTRDVWRVRLVIACIPFMFRRWHARVDQLARAHVNRRLAEALPSTEPVVATAGFTAIVTPLVAALGFPDARIVAAQHRGCIDRRNGKLHLTLAALGPDVVGRSLVLTDSSADRSLLDACARPLRTVWPEARYEPAFQSLYLPGQYITKVKRPGARYILRGILQEDFALWLLSSIGLSTQPVLHVVGLLLLLLSFWTIYERGYVANDLAALRFEVAPNLNPAFANSAVATPRFLPWVWAVTFALLAIAVLDWRHGPILRHLVAWVLVLAATYGWFLLYNRLDKNTRVWLFTGLQLARSAAFAAVVAVSPIGAVALGAHVVAKWVPYYIYRRHGTDWPEAPFHLIRLLFFVVLASLVSVAAGPGLLLNYTAPVVFAWMLLRARKELAAAVAAAHRIDRIPPGTPP